jgi:hypothetical protein
MEIRLSLGLLALLGVMAFGLTSRMPEAVPASRGDAAHELAELEDAFAAAHDDLALAQRLSASYLRLGEPALAIGVVRSVTPDLVTDPILTHRLAQGYEAVGRLDDAVATAAVAHARCLRAVGSSEALAASAPAGFACSPAALVALEQHAQALSHMLRWGVTDPVSDPRARQARRLAERRVRIASLDQASESF